MRHDRHRPGHYFLVHDWYTLWLLVPRENRAHVPCDCRAALVHSTGLALRSGAISQLQCVGRLLCLFCGLCAGPALPLVLSRRWAQQVSDPVAPSRHERARVTDVN